MYRHLFSLTLPNAEILDHRPRKAVNYDMTTDQVKELSILCSTASKKNKDLTQLLIASSDLAFGMGRLSEVYMSEFGWNIVNFRELSVAEEWLQKNLSSKSTHTRKPVKIRQHT